MNYFEITMFVIFILLTIGMMYKIKTWMPTQALADDDRDAASIAELEEIIIDTIKDEYNEALTAKEVFEKMQAHKKLDKKHYWRVNENRVMKLIEDIYAKHEGVSTFKDIKEKL